MFNNKTILEFMDLIIWEYFNSMTYIRYNPKIIIFSRDEMPVEMAKNLEGDEKSSLLLLETLGTKTD